VRNPMGDRYSGLMFERREHAGDARRRRRHGLLHRLRRRRPEPRIEVYHGYGTTERLYIKGRVLRDPGTREIDADAGALKNLRNTLRRALTDEIPFAQVRARFGGCSAEAQADREGFFGAVLVLDEPVDPDSEWVEIELELLDPEPAPSGGGRATARVLVPSRDAEFGVISDIDDTVVRTEATSLLRMLRIVLLTNAHSRMPFAHVDSLYRALREGSDGERRNPVFYLSSSPWNFYDLLEEFFRVHDIPEGPLFLRDWNFSPRKLLGMGHQEHKLIRLRHLFEVYPELPWVLIGDSGQEDPEIYREAVREYPGRVRAVYIRNVASGARAAEVEALAEEVRALGTPMLLVEEKTEAAAHAAEHGLICQSALRHMRAADADPEPEPDLLEKLVNPEAR
jgi:phosphatidate phosphatase APP1